MTIPYPEEKVLQDQLSMLNPDEIKAANKTIKKSMKNFLHFAVEAAHQQIPCIN